MLTGICVDEVSTWRQINKHFLSDYISKLFDRDFEVHSGIYIGNWTYDDMEGYPPMISFYDCFKPFDYALMFYKVHKETFL